MELSDQDIALIEQYLEGELSGSALSDFEGRMADPDFAAEVELMRDLIGGTQAAGRHAMKAELGAIGAAMLAGNEISDYSPPDSSTPPDAPGKSGSAGIGGKLATLLFLAAAGYGSYLWFTDQFPPQWLRDQLPAQEQAQPESNTPAATPTTRTVVHDTVYKDASGNIITKEQYEKAAQGAR